MYDDLFQQAADAYKLNPELLKSVAENESGFNPNAVSKDDKGNPVAYGLMQFTPETAQSLKIDPNDPKQAIWGAAKLLKQNLDASQGDLNTALMMYHGGTDQSNWGEKTHKYADNVLNTYAKNIQSTLANNDPIVKMAGGVSDSSQDHPLSSQDPVYQFLNSGGKVLPGQTPDKADLIPATDAQGNPVQVQNAPQPEPTALDKYVIGPAAAATSMAVGSVAAPVGTLYGIGKEIVSGKFGTPEGGNIAETEAQKAINYLTPQPTSPGGQQALQTASDVINNSGIQAIAPIADVAAALNTVPKVYIGQKVSGAAEQLQNQFQNRLPNAESTAYGSVGSAAATDPEIAIKTASQGSPELASKVNEAIQSGEPVNLSAVERQAEATSLPDPINLTKGQASQDLSQLSLEQNNRGKFPELANQFNEQNEKLINNTNLIRENVAPDVYVNTKPEIADMVINAYKDIDKNKVETVSSNYKALTDANGGQFPVDGQQLAQNIEQSLSKNLKSEFLPSSIQSQLNKFANGQPMTFENFEAMRTNIASEIRKAERAGDGNAAMALSLAREQMEQLPLVGEAANLKPLADTARTSARERFQVIGNDPIYSAFDKGTITPDTLINKYIIGGSRDQVQTIMNNLKDYPEAQQAIKAGIIDHLKERANIVDNKGNFGQAGYNKSLQTLKPKLDIIFKPEEIKQLQALGNTARITQFFPKGSFVNTSNTLVGSLASSAKKGAEGAVNYLAHGIPVGSYIGKKISERATNKWVRSSVEPGAGIKLKDIGK